MSPRRETSIDCVQKIIGRFKSDGLIENKSGRGRKSILSDVAKRKVLKDIKIDPKLSAVKLAAETPRIMGKVDESKFNISGSDGRRTVWRKPNTVLDPKNLRPTVKHGSGSVMVWGCMASNEQDNDSKHTARNVEMWCLFHCKQQLHSPPQSPDINVIENLWATLEIVVQKHQIRNKTHLKQVLQEEWDKISPDTTKNWSNRYQDVWMTL
ncbi:transposable element Tc1 transposase [Trichonephila clavipes]|nr:transposable element Tc1 transposase [Trichonephila clavipes]